MAHVPSHRRLASGDAALCLLANSWCGRSRWRHCFARVSRLGDGPAWYALMGLLVLADGLDGLAVSLRLALTGVVTLAIYRAMKRWTRRPRPFASDQRIRAWVAPLDEFSFPSGHTLHAVAFTTVTLAFYPVLGWVLLPFTAAIAVSRVVLGLHYPSDVLVALALGLMLGGLGIWLVPALV